MGYEGLRGCLALEEMEMCIGKLSRKTNLSLLLPGDIKIIRKE